MCTCYDSYVTDIMSSLESGLSDTQDSMAVVSDDEIIPEPKIFTSDTESDPDMLFEDEDDFQPFALPYVGDDLPIADSFPDEDPFDIPTPVHDHLIIGHPDGEHIVTPILDVVPLVGDGEIDEDVVAVPPPEIPVVEISSDPSLHSVSDCFESVTSSTM
ncbi:hypothetical protein Hanom_Chr08g00727381 [Helianthus anomalus]